MPCVRPQLDLSSNSIGGYYENGRGYGKVIATPEGPKAIADALLVCASLTSLDVRFNSISGNGASQLSTAVLGNTKIETFNKVPIKEMRADSFTELNLSNKYIGVEGGMVVAGLLPVMPSLTKLNVKHNALGEGAAVLRTAFHVLTVVEGRSGFELKPVSLCGPWRLRSDK